jgi:drug/metabolite transporter (DMT)-like permease
MPDLPAETHGLGPFLFPRHHLLRIPMKTRSRAFYFVAILGILLALAGAFMAGYYSGRNHSLAKLGQQLGFWGAVLGVFASVVHKKQKGNPASPR